MNVQKEISMGKPIFKQLNKENQTQAKIYLSLHNNIISDQYLLRDLRLEEDENKELIEHVNYRIEKNIEIMKNIVVKSGLRDEVFFFLISELNGKQLY